MSTQEHVSDTLLRAVATDRVGHAYLFCGPRGVGKTTLARVLAMALNCPDRGEDGEPCGTCDSCSRIWAGHTSLDVVEIDAASNRGVDDARELRERAMYAPSEEGRFKVYILDEAHMLTREAWNALLKIIEEPPPRVIFIFATTEPQKIQQTAAPILSRCQRFDFRRIGAGDIAQRLSDVLGQEGIEATADVLRAIARKANGGMRDGLSLTDQVLALSDGTLSIDAVVRVLGVVSEERYLELFDVLADHRHGAVFDFVEVLLDEGYDLVEFYHGLTEKIRLLLRLALEPDSPPRDLGPEQHQAFLSRAQRFSPGDLVRLLSMATELESSGSLRRTGRPRVLIEMLLLRMSYLDRTVELEALVQALGGSGSASPPSQTPNPSRPSSQGSSVSGPSSAAGGQRSSASGPSSSSGGPVPTDREAGSVSEQAPPRASAPETPEANGVQSSPAPPAPSAPEVSSGQVETAAPSEGTERPADQANTPASPAPRVGGKPLGLVAAWNKLLNSGEGIPNGLRPFLRAARVTEQGDVLSIRLPGGPGAEKLRDPVVLRTLSDGLALHSNRPSVEISLEGAPSNGGGNGESGRVTEGTVRETRLRDLIEREPLLQQAVDELDLELMD